MLEPSQDTLTGRSSTSHSALHSASATEVEQEGTGQAQVCTLHVIYGRAIEERLKLRIILYSSTSDTSASSTSASAVTRNSVCSWHVRTSRVPLELWLCRG
ncbi:hypothetical protein CY34DRAFT_811213 [Suillus luteus UH-Slu-Lm8-n1]|uniref:Uncharacterized protein n=1 Tax=Suillus luteus UH-Slu-Lm8-n1 TaxID=930992 RepID=A0A0D0AXG6_9AGAM|nr:hypothetical protein CY34DRAFT_811213 [Suillus luteus UH-Slu-Lm8-n1]